MPRRPQAEVDTADFSDSDLDSNFSSPPLTPHSPAYYEEDWSDTDGDYCESEAVYVEKERYPSFFLLGSTPNQADYETASESSFEYPRERYPSLVYLSQEEYNEWENQLDEDYEYESPVYYYVVDREVIDAVDKLEAKQKKAFGAKKEALIKELNTPVREWRSLALKLSLLDVQYKTRKEDNYSNAGLLSSIGRWKTPKPNPARLATIKGLKDLVAKLDKEVGPLQLADETSMGLQYRKHTKDEAQYTRLAKALAVTKGLVVKEFSSIKSEYWFFSDPKHSSLFELLSKMVERMDEPARKSALKAYEDYEQLQQQLAEEQASMSNMSVA